MEIKPIPYEERAKVYEEAIAWYGVPSRSVLAVEEMSELTKVLCKEFRFPLDLAAMIEEIADVTIMMEQLRLAYNINAEVAALMDYKVQRLRENILRDKTIREVAP